MNLRLKPAESGDLKAIHHLISILEDEDLPLDSFTSVFQKNLSDFCWSMFVIQVENEMAGFCSLHFKNSLHHATEIAELEEIILLPEYRNQGLGGDVIRKLQQKCKERAISQLEVCRFTDSHHKLVLNF
jgi:N-acetylglutamate synthase-like GNAT family acetyltransferase